MIRSSGALLGFVGLALAGCGSAEPLGSGSVALDWQVSPRGCEEAGVETIEARISGPEGVVERFDCGAGGAEMVGLEPGVYDLELVGLDGVGTPTFESPKRTVTVDADRATDLGTLRLTARPAQIEVGWRFADGRVCGANEVDTIVLAVFDGYDYEVARAPFDCDEGAGAIGDIVAGAYLVEATAYSGSSATHRGVVTIKAGRGEVVTAEIVLDPSR